MGNIKKYFKNSIKQIIFRDLLSKLNSRVSEGKQRNPEYLEWINSDLVDIAGEFVAKNKLTESPFIRFMNKTFDTARFDLLLKRWVVDYLFRLFRILDDFSGQERKSDEKLMLEDTPLNRYAFEKYSSRFGVAVAIKWILQPNLFLRLFNIFILGFAVLFLSLNSGIKLSAKRKKYKVMREAIWGLYGVGGYYFHDDFMVDGKKIKEQDLLLYTRGKPSEGGRIKGYHDARKSPYRHFTLGDQPIGLNVLVRRVISKHFIHGGKALFCSLFSKDYVLFSNLFFYFIACALPYEKIFSNFEVTSELGHNFFSPSHIAEAIICQNYGTGYYLMHWSDISIAIDKYLLSFLGCDKFLLWGRAHIEGVEGKPEILFPTGYVFKSFIKEVATKRVKILSDMGIRVRGKSITFFDETFGRECKMTGEHFVAFWETALKLALTEKDHTVIMKPKILDRYKGLPDHLRERYVEVKKQLEKAPNVYIIDPNKWSFIEAVGISDVVVTQGMTSSATIAIICGIEGLYLDQAHYNHPFKKFLMGKIVFDDPEKLIQMIRQIINVRASVLKGVPEQLLRSFDAYADERGLDLFRDILSKPPQRSRVGVIIQARMGATRLPGKVMKDLAGKPVLQHIIDRVKACNNINEIVLATTDNRADDVLAKLGHKNEIKVYRGSEENVLSRYYHAAKAHDLKVIVRITADCPFIDPEMIDKMIDIYKGAEGLDYLSNTVKRTFPRGLDVEIMSFSALEKAHRSAQKLYQKEHVTPYIYENAEEFSLEHFCAEQDNSYYRLTLDTPEDYRLIKELYSRLLSQKPNFVLNDVLRLLKENEDLLLINTRVRQKALCD